MAISSSSSSSSCSNSLKNLFLIFQLLSTYTLLVNGCYTSIISFGDSLADTGNLKQLTFNSNDKTPHFMFPPYGETFFHKPTGRCSNGRLIIDFTAEGLGLPVVPPYLGGNRTDFAGGVNYAVAGATALDSSFHEARGVFNPYTNASLGVQMEWFKQSFTSFCSNTSDCKSFIRRSLFLMGEIGGNDYNHPLSDGKSMDEVESYVPLVVNVIVSAINELIEVGAETLVIPGNLPIGCSTFYWTKYYGSAKEEYDNTTGCLIRLNKFAEYHNEILQRELNQVRELHPNINIIYADYYNAAMQIFHSPNEFGFTNGALKACCGGGGPFNYNPGVACANPSSTNCAQPHTYDNWDGLHLTEATYKLLYKSLFQGSYTIPRFNSLCTTSVLQGTGELSSYA